MLAVDSSIKIKIIKEVRSILGLGLKEVIIYNIKAKELVEKAPTIIKKDLPKNLAEEMIEKFKAAGCNVNMIWIINLINFKIMNLLLRH